MAAGIVGQTFGTLTVVEKTGRDKQGNAQYTVLCSCGGSRDLVLAHNLKSGRTASCGCVRRKHEV